MTSENIYSHTAVDRTPYTYYICWSYLGLHYYGRRTAKGCHPDDLWTKYFTSSNKVTEFRKHYGEPDIIEVRYTFDSIEKCKECEERVLKYNNAARSENWLNGSNGDNRWDTTGKFMAKSKDGKKYFISCEDPSYIAGYLVGASKGIKQKSKHSGTTTVYDIFGNCFRVEIVDPDLLSGKLKGVKSGYVNVRFPDGSIQQISKYDERYIRGELKHHSSGVPNVKVRGMITVRDPKNPDTCFNVKNDDPRYLSGELKPASCGVRLHKRGYVTVRDPKNPDTCFNVKNDDPRYLSGEFKSVSIGLKRERKLCPFCKKDFSANIFVRFHGEKCKKFIAENV